MPTDLTPAEQELFVRLLRVIETVALTHPDWIFGVSATARDGEEWGEVGFTVTFPDGQSLRICPRGSNKR